jgi:hypothetical protein
MIATTIVTTTTEGQDPSSPSLKMTDTKLDPTMSIRKTEEITDLNNEKIKPNTTQSPTNNKGHTTELKITIEAMTDAKSPISETTNATKDQDSNLARNPANPEAMANKKTEVTTKTIVNNSWLKITTSRGLPLQLKILKITFTSEKNPISRICRFSSSKSCQSTNLWESKLSEPKLFALSSSLKTFPKTIQT